MTGLLGCRRFKPLTVSPGRVVELVLVALAVLVAAGCQAENEKAHRAMCRPIEPAVAASDAPQPRTADNAEPLALLPEGAELPPVAGTPVGEPTWDGEFDRQDMIAAGPDEGDRERRLADLEWEATARRVWMTGDGGEATDIALRVDVERFAAHEGAMGWQAWVLRNGCRFYSDSDRVEAVPNGVRVRWPTEDGGRAEQLSFVHGPVRVRMDTHRSSLPDEPVLEDVAVTVHQQVSATLEADHE